MRVIFKPDSALVPLYFFVVVFWMLAGCNEDKNDLIPDQNNPNLIEWEITDHISHETSKGSFQYSSEVVLTETREDSDGNEFFRRSIPLEQNFQLGGSIVPFEAGEEFTGFGLWVENRLFSTFSWEWFSVEADAKAIKQQGNGEVEFNLTSRNSKSQLNSVSFLSDVIFRIKDLENEDLNVQQDIPGIEYRWSCKVFKGSNLQF